MIAVNQYYHKWKHIPKPAKLFLVKGLGLLIIWKLLYLTLLLPTRILDKPLSNSVGAATAATLNVVSGTRVYTIKQVVNQSEFERVMNYEPAVAIYKSDKRTLAIADPCNGLELFVLYAGFIICLPASLLRKTAFITGGMVLIWTVNVLRCVALVYIYLYNPKYLNFSHHYAFKFLVYGFIFFLWLLFSKKLMDEKSA